MPQVSCVCLTCHQSFTAHACHVRSGSGKYCSVPCYRQRPVPALADRFWALVLKTDGCWLWQGERTRYGYGRYSVGKKRRMPAHRIAYELTFDMLRALKDADSRDQLPVPVLGTKPSQA